MQEAAEAQLISIREAAALAGVSYLTVWRATRRGDVPVYRIGNEIGPLRLDKHEFLEWIYGEPKEAA